MFWARSAQDHRLRPTHKKELHLDMNLALTDQQQADQQSFRQFVDARIVPYADQFDREERTPAELIRAIADQGYLGAAIPQALGGTGSDMVTFGLLNEELGRGC